MMGNPIILSAACLLLPILDRPHNGIVSVEIAQTQGEMCVRVGNGTPDPVRYQHGNGWLMEPTLRIERENGDGGPPYQGRYISPRRVRGSHWRQERYATMPYRFISSPPSLNAIAGVSSSLPCTATRRIGRSNALHRSSCRRINYEITKRDHDVFGSHIAERGLSQSARSGQAAPWRRVGRRQGPGRRAGVPDRPQWHTGQAAL